jgi:valyl-tRNA synthetase
VADLEGLGLLEKIEPYQSEVGHSDRSKTPIEPYLSEQWFVNMGDRDGQPGLAQTAMEAVTDGRVKFHPERYGRTYLDWLSVKRDWCISRQLWWGHQIPIWKAKQGIALSDEFWPKGGDSAPTRGVTEIYGNPVSYQLRAEEDGTYMYTCVPDGYPQTEVTLERCGFVRDPDVLDTWFSSALWPFSTLGWPDQTPDLKAFYPTNVLVTAREIITLWVARMVMMGLYNQPRGTDLPAREQVPFSDVYIHAMIQDGDGRPMKKSLGNGVDPLDIIATHGTDALRFTVAWMATETQDVRLPVVKDAATGRNTSPKFDMGRNFCNKLWNAMRFALMNLAGVEETTEGECHGLLANRDHNSPSSFDVSAMRLEDRWILSRSEQVCRKVTEELEAFQFQASLTALYDFFWHDLCDWYLEVIKPRMADRAARGVPQRVLALVLDRTLRLLHPYVPFITEAAWEGLNATIRDRSLPGLAAAPPSEKLITAAWPEATRGVIDVAAEQEFALRQELIEGVRKAKAESGQSASDVEVYIPEPGDRRGLIESTLRDFAALAMVTRSYVGEQPPAGRVCASTYLASYGMSVYVPMPEEMIRRERDRIVKEIEMKRKLLVSIEGKLANKQFTDRAPAEVVEREKARAEEARVAIVALEKRTAELG